MDAMRFARALVALEGAGLLDTADVLRELNGRVEALERRDGGGRKPKAESDE